MKEFLLGFVVGCFGALSKYESILRFIFLLCKGKIKLIDRVDPSKVGICKAFYRIKLSNWLIAINLLFLFEFFLKGSLPIM